MTPYHRTRFGDVRGDVWGDARADARGDVRGDEDERLERCDERGVGELGEERPLDDRSLDDRPLDVRLIRVRGLVCPWS